MERLRVRNPDIVTRVTEYVPEIVEFVQGIIKNGYGYEFEGSVYFDTVAFDSSDRHDYAKIEPWSKGNRELLAEGEGLLIFFLSGSVSDCSYCGSQGCSHPSRDDDQPPISRSGRRPSQENLHGRHLGVQVAQAGILNALSWLVLFLGTTWTFTLVALTLHFRTTTMKWLNLRSV
jgi:hypothetical protein